MGLCHRVFCGARVRALLVAVFCSAAALATAGAATATTTQPTAALSRSGAAATPPLKVVVGFYAATLQGLDQQDSSYYADFFLWMRWKPIPGNEVDPSATVEFTNNIERWGLTQTAVYEKPKKLADGQLVQSWRVQGRFFRPLDLTNYPLDKQTLTLNVEDTANAQDVLQYVADTGQSGTDAGIKLPGWNVNGSNVTIASHPYHTNFGEPAAKDPNQQTYAAATLNVSISRPPTFFYWKLSCR